MDEGLFTKYTKTVRERQDAKKTLIDRIKEKTGVGLTEEEITLSKKQVTLFTSSVKKTALIRKNIKEILEAEGFIFKN
jgi:hypothetical protein